MFSRVHFTLIANGTNHSALFRSRRQAIRFASRINREGWGAKYIGREDDAAKRKGETLFRYADSALQEAIVDKLTPQPLYRESRGVSFFHHPGGGCTAYGRPTI